MCSSILRFKACDKLSQIIYVAKKIVSQAVKTIFFLLLYITLTRYNAVSEEEDK